MGVRGVGLHISKSNVNGISNNNNKSKVITISHGLSCRVLRCGTLNSKP